MNYKLALNLLEIDESNIDETIIKKKYKYMALKYHPDKNKLESAKNDFQRINDAYEYLMKYEGYMDSDNETFSEEKQDENNYNSMLYQFINIILQEQPENNYINHIVKNIMNMCEDKTISYLKTIEKKKVISLYNFINKYKQIFHYSNQFIDKIKLIIQEKTKNDEVIILNPSIDDLFNHNIYKLNYNNNYYYIPLWHSEVLVDLSNNEVYVKNIPSLPEHIFIDDKNNINITCNYTINELFDSSIHKIKVCEDKNVYINSENLLIKKKQIIRLPNEGIPKTSSNNVFDVSKLSDIFLHINIHK